jgi:hypothetical protein
MSRDPLAAMASMMRAVIRTHAVSRKSACGTE